MEGPRMLREKTTLYNSEKHHPKRVRGFFLLPWKTPKKERLTGEPCGPKSSVRTEDVQRCFSRFKAPSNHQMMQ